MASPKTWQTIRGNVLDGGAPYTVVKTDLTKAEARSHAAELDAKEGRIANPNKPRIHFFSKM